MATLYVTEPGARVEKEYQRLLVTKEDEVLASVPVRKVSEVVLVGWAGITTPAMLSLLDQGVGLSLVTRSGRLRGRLQPAGAPNLPLRLAQYRRQEESEFCLSVSRQIVAGKLFNYRTLAMRMLRGIKEKNPYAAVQSLEVQRNRLEDVMGQIDSVKDLAALRGLEGAGSKAYFAILRAALRWEGDMPFTKRVRRPPRDPVNALLSFGYSMLTQAIFTAVEVSGLDPYAGFFHSETYGRPALVLDLEEEFRSLIVDSLVLRLVNMKMLKEKHFELGENDAVYLNRSGLKIFLTQFAKKLQTSVYHPKAGRSLSYQKCMEIQARNLREVIEGKQDHYQTMRTR